MANIARRPDGRWRARYRCEYPCPGRVGQHEHAQHFARKVDAEDWLDAHTTAVRTGTYVDPKTAKTTVKEWAATWIDGYGTRRASTVRQARVHLAQIEAAFGSMPLSSVRPSHVKAWTAKLRAEGLADSYIYALHRRLSQLMSDAVHDGIIPRSPCSRRTSPGAGSQRAYVATTEQIWALVDGFPEREQVAVLLGAFVGLRVAEACGLRVADVDFTRGIITPAVQYPAQPLKNEASGTPVPIPQSLALDLAAQVKRWPAPWLLTNESNGQLSVAALERRMRAVRKKVKGLPEGFRYHDLRHYFASLLIASGADVKAVQTRLRHASAMTTLSTYSHLWPDSDDRTRAAVGDVLAARADFLRTPAVVAP